MFYIVNDIDRPDERHVTIKEGPYFIYIHPDLIDWAGMNSEMATPLRDFGFEWTHSSSGTHFQKVKKSIATYKDGKPRRWQGANSFFIEWTRK